MLLIAPLLPLILTGAIASPPPSLPGGRWCAVAVTEGYSIFLLAVSLSGSCTFNVKASHKITKYLQCKSGILIDVKVHVICPLLENGSPLKFKNETQALKSCDVTASVGECLRFHSQ